MTVKSLLLGAISVGAVAAIAGCGSSTATSTSSGGGSTPKPAGSSGSSGNTGSNGTAAAANTLLSVSDVQTISGDPNVAPVSGGCTATTCVYADTTAAGGGGGGVIVVEQIPGGLSQAELQLALSGALSAGGSDSSGGTVTSVSGLGSAAIKDIDANSATYAFSKDNYFVVINVTSSTNTGAAMDSQVQAAAQTAAGQI
jgi:hypothetical protein